MCIKPGFKAILLCVVRHSAVCESWEDSFHFLNLYDIIRVKICDVGEKTSFHLKFAGNGP